MSMMLYIHMIVHKHWGQSLGVAYFMFFWKVGLYCSHCFRIEITYAFFYLLLFGPIFSTLLQIYKGTLKVTWLGARFLMNALFAQKHTRTLPMFAFESHRSYFTTCSHHPSFLEKSHVNAFSNREKDPAPIFGLTPARSGRPRGSSRMRPRRGSWTCRICSHGTWAGTWGRSPSPCSNPAPVGKIAPKPGNRRPD